MFILKLVIAHIFEKGNAALSSGGIAEVWCGDEVSVFLPPDPPGPRRCSTVPHGHHQGWPVAFALIGDGAPVGSTP